MKKLFFALLTMTCVHASAQDNKDRYQRAVNYLGCRIMAYTLQDTQQVAFLKLYPCDGTQDFIQMKAYLNQRHKELNADLLDEIEQLNKTTPPHWTDSAISSFLTSGIFNDKVKYQKIHAFYEKHENDPNFPDLIRDIREKISDPAASKRVDSIQRAQTASTRVPADTISSPDSKPALTTAPAQNDEVEKSWFEGLKFEIDVFSILFTLIVGVVLVIGRRNQGSAEVPEKFRKYVKEKLDRFSDENTVRNPTERLERELRDLAKLVEEQRRQLRELTMKGTGTPADADRITWVSEPVLAAPLKEVQDEIIYLPTPREDRSFDNNFASAVYREGTSIYKAIKKEGNRAIFQIDEHPTAVKLALQYADLRIEPCCIPLNAYNSDSRRIELVKPGELELKENRWVILSKMEIRYEN